MIGTIGWAIYNEAKRIAVRQGEAGVSFSTLLAVFHEPKPKKIGAKKKKMELLKQGMRAPE